MRYLNDLNERQREAVLHTEGPLLIIAGAGAGKTRVIAHRVLHLIKKGVPPEQILAITFTNKAAKEMRDRIAHLLNLQPTTNYLQQKSDGRVVGSRLSVVGAPWIGTFHSLGAHILRERQEEAGLPKRFTIFDKSDSLSAVKSAMREADVDPKTFAPAALLSAISREKGNRVTLAEFQGRATDYYPRIIATVWEKYEAKLREEKALDFDDLLLKSALLLEQKEIREAYQKRFRYIHVDEYQDTNRVQYHLVRLLAERERNIAVVGDIDQNIYSWRGATIRNILEFEKEYPDAKVVLLEENYRSTRTILSVANQIIRKNKLRREKTLFTKNNPGEKIGLFGAQSEADEAYFAAQKSKQLIEAGVAPSDIAILFRTNFQSRVLEEAFLASEVPYQVLGVRFFERKEVKDLLSYVRLARTNFAEQNLHGGPLSEGFSDIKRVINVPPRGLGKVTLLKMLAGDEARLPEATRKKIKEFRGVLQECKAALLSRRISEALKVILKISGLEAFLKEGGSDDEERLLNLQELVSFALKYDGLAPEEAAERLLEEAALQSDQDELKEEKNAVRLMTVHAAKGLEFRHVFVTGLEEELFPHQSLRDEEAAGGPKAEERGEEERRLFYVALTRAKEKVYLSYSSVRTLFGRKEMRIPSEFIFDIDEELLEPEERFEGGGKITYID